MNVSLEYDEISLKLEEIQGSAKMTCTIISIFCATTASVNSIVKTERTSHTNRYCALGNRFLTVRREYENNKILEEMSTLIHVFLSRVVA